VSIGTLAAILSAAAILGAFGKWVFDHVRSVVVATDEHPIKEMDAQSAAAGVIAKAAGSVVVMLQNQLTENAARMTDMQLKMTSLGSDLQSLHDREQTCRQRLAALEEQLGIQNG
jgi:peptidoglycan hydrolase CwlO-like protein